MTVHKQSSNPKYPSLDDVEDAKTLNPDKRIGMKDPVPHKGPPYEDELEDKDKHSGLKAIISTVALIIIAPVIALLLTAFVFQSYEVDGASMETTLFNSERLIVLKVPRTLAKITGHPYIPHRGDVIIFNLNEGVDLGPTGKRQLVKRVIGLPGDRVVVKKGVVTVYNGAYPNGFHPDQSLPYGKVITNTGGDVDTYVLPDHVFVMGDNRDNSLDSRIFGPISADDVVGKLEARIYPFNKFKLF